MIFISSDKISKNVHNVDPEKQTQDGFHWVDLWFSEEAFLGSLNEDLRFAAIIIAMRKNRAMKQRQQ